jgi:protein-S-isoprenylcysteine O-methyltransferase Ste14
MCAFVNRLGLVVIGLAIAVLLAAGQFVSPAPAVIAAQILAIALAVWARRSLAGAFAVTAAPRGDAVVDVGPYRWIRHPQYAAALLLISASVLAHLSVLSVAVEIVVVVVGVARIVCEERLLRERFPAYAEYAARTKRVVPFLV